MAAVEVLDNPLVQADGRPDELEAAAADLEAVLDGALPGAGKTAAAAIKRLVVAANAHKQQQPLSDRVAKDLEESVLGIYGRLTEAPTNWQ